MEELLPFIIPGMGVFLLITGAWKILYNLLPKKDLDPSAPGDLDCQVRARVLNTRISGIFWISLGVATVWFSELRAPWILPGVGLFWMIVGVSSFVSTFRRKRRDAIAAELSKRQATFATTGTTSNHIRFAGVLAGALCIGIGFLIVWFSGIRVGRAPAASIPPSTSDSRLAERVTEHVVRDFEHNERVGLVVGAIAKGEQVLFGFGARQLGDTKPPDADTVFEIGSITKVFTGILLAQAVENGELKLDDRIADLLPEGWSLAEAARGITLQHCTTHTTGFPRLPDNLTTASSAVGYALGGDPYRHYSEEAFREALKTVELECQPGASSGYSNFAVGLLGFVLARQQGTDYESLVRQRICQPLGMHHTANKADPGQFDHLSDKYRSVFRIGSFCFALQGDYWQLPDSLAGAGAIRSTGRDMMAFLQANMGGDPTPIDAAIQRSHQELFREHPRRTIGMNWVRSYDPLMSQNVIWHNGGTSGFKSYLGFTEDGQFGVVVLSNTARSVNSLGEDILKSLVAEFDPSSHKLVTEHGYGKVAPYTGVRWENGQPIVEVQGSWSPLVSIDGIPIDRIMDFAKQRFGNKARKRLAEDLVELFSAMGHEPQWNVTLGLMNSNGQIECLQAMMTEENRRQVRE